jgi:glutamyl-tRNA(Gln) amidotransferase subunit E
MSYEKLGLKCGIEIHQQLEGKKLFCGCATRIRDDAPDFTISRRLRAAAGESGEVDVAARQEQVRGRTFVYEGYHDSNCLVEVDEEPPHDISQEALYTCLQFCKLANVNIAQIVQVMRKTVVDGSNTSGFQRTALIGMDGEISSSLGKVRIANVSLEEDACKIISDSPDKKVYRLDRLGIPLIEIGTHPDIKTPEQCQEVAGKLGMLLRSLPGLKRGLGTIRQDVNVSIKGGTRIEIKGAQDLKQIALLVELEAKRQLELLRIKNELKKVKVAVSKVVDLSSIFQKSAAKIVKSILKDKGMVLGIKLTGWSGYLGRELQPGYRLGTELAGRTKIIAGVKGIFHSDELPNYGISDSEVAEVRRKLKCGTKDAFVLVAEEESKAKLALEQVKIRLQEVLQGIPKEVRKANADGTTSYLRPMPGAARMYPETDVSLIEPNMKVSLPELLEDKAARFAKLGLSNDLAMFMVKSDKVNLFEELVKLYPEVKAAFIAETLTSTVLEIKRKYGLNAENLQSQSFKDLFKYLKSGKIHKDIVLDVLIDMIKGKFLIEKYAALSTEEIHKIISDIVQKNKGAPFGAVMGMCMKELNGKASGQVISAELKKIL